MGKGISWVLTQQVLCFRWNVPVALRGADSRLGQGLEAHQVRVVSQLRLEGITATLRQHCENVAETQSRDPE